MVAVAWAPPTFSTKQVNICKVCRIPYCTHGLKNRIILLTHKINIQYNLLHVLDLAVICVEVNKSLSGLELYCSGNTELRNS